MSDTSRGRGRVPELPRESWWARLWSPFWMVPLASSLAALGAGVALPELERAITDELPFVFPGGPDGARSVLSTITSAMISVTGLVFSITMVVLQLASSQFTPRVIAPFLQSRTTQGTLGVFIAAFVFSLTVLRSVEGDSRGGAFVPQLSVTVAYLLVLTSVAFFLAFIHHITTSIQVSRVISAVGERTVDLVEDILPDSDSDSSGPTWSPRPSDEHGRVRAGRAHGNVVAIEFRALVAVARETDSVISLDVGIGDFVIEGQPLAQTWGAVLDADAARRLDAAVRRASERTLVQDPAFGIRQLVDIAERALSPGINDPTTAVQAIDELHRILRVVVQRPDPSPYVADVDHRVRVVHRPDTAADLVQLAVEEVAHYGRDSVQVPRRLASMLDDLESCARPEHLGALARARGLIRSPDET